MKKKQLTILANVASGTHDGTLTLRAHSAIAAHTAVCITANGAESVASGNQEPHGISLDEAQSGEYLAIALFGSASSTLKLRTATNIPAGSTVIMNSDGLGTTLPVIPGAYMAIGISLHAANAGELIEIDPRPPMTISSGE